MIDINTIVRPNILALKPYSSARDEFSGKEGIFLDANENPYGTLNRYPDPYQTKLKQKLSGLKQVSIENVFIGNGSDEVVDLVFRLFCSPGLDKALTFTPSYGMYEVSAAINDVQLIKLPLNEDFQLNLDSLNPFLKDKQLKLIFICSPNNPTGNLMKEKDVEFILQNFNGMVVLDEAYIDFAKNESLIKWIENYNNLIVIQTLSKAWGMAAVRVGAAYSNPDVIQLLNKIKPPYNVSKINQEAAIAKLEDQEEYEQQVSRILDSKKQMIKELEKISLIKRIYPSDANFLLIEVENADKLYQELVDHKIIIRNRNKLISNCLRISIGTPEENESFLEALKSQI